jgi:hypothetical protein
MDALADLDPCWSQTHYVGFVVTRLIYILQPQYKESDVFLARFRQCLSRALNLMKTHVMNILQAATLHVKNAKVLEI